VDVALDYNQIGSVDDMMAYVCKYQQDYVSAHLFHNNLLEMMDKGVTMTPILESQIYNHTFDYDEWPGISTHTNGG
jgi:hypothetical protein